MEPVETEAFNAKFIGGILTRLKRNANAGPFLHPVDPIALGIPDYTEKIKQPMDLSTIKEKVDNKKYSTNREFEDDMKLMFDNCYLYNGETSPVGQMGKELQKAFEKIYNNQSEEVKKVKRSVSVKMSTEDFETANYVLNELEKPKYKKTVWPFLHPVTDAEAPGYSAIVKKPMDLSTLRRKLDGRNFESLKAFLADLQLICDNCKLYNPDNSEIFRLGVELEKAYKRELAKKEAGPDGEIDELRKKISEMMQRLSALEEAKRQEDPNYQTFSIEERERVGSSILALGREESDKIVEIIQRSCSSFSYVGNDEIEVNILTLPDHVIGEIKEFLRRLDNKIQESNDVE